MTKKQLIVLSAASALLVGTAMAIAQDAVKVQPDKNKVLFENDRVRVVEVKNPPGGTLDMHSHPAHVVYFLESATTKMTTKDGKESVLEGKKGEARWVDPVTHKVDNTGKTPVHAIVVELKDAAK